MSLSIRPPVHEAEDAVVATGQHSHRFIRRSGEEGQGPGLEVVTVKLLTVDRRVSVPREVIRVHIPVAEHDSAGREGDADGASVLRVPGEGEDERGRLRDSMSTEQS